MRTILFAAAIATVAQMSVSTTGLAADKATTSVARSGQMLYDSTGHRVASVNRITQNGDVQVILNGQLVTVPASTLSQANGKLTTSLTKAEIPQKSA
jgi:hypothetical protein